MELSGELRQWHKITLDIEGPSGGENANTFRNNRFDVTFTNEDTGTVVTVPGYFAADGDAANSGATGGNVWRAHFNPPETGTWSWEVSFRQGTDVAVSSNPSAGRTVSGVDGQSGTFEVDVSDKTGDDLRAKGMLQYDGDQYLNFAGDGSVFLKSGVGSPENFLAYSEFDNTPDSHDYQSHIGDYDSGDPLWGNGKGKAIIGAVNYLAEQDVNSAYMMLMNVGGDGRDVWPWADRNLDDIAKSAGENIDLTTQARAFDVSKLDQWEIVFAHMQEKGITLHLFFQEQENDQLLNDGELGLERMLYMREMLARFGHHNGVIFNLGEENTNSTSELTDHSAYLKSLDPYGHPVALHTYPNQLSKYEAFEGTDTLDVLSFQTNRDTIVPDLDRYLGGAADAGRPVVGFLDEPGNASVGLAAEGDSGWRSNHENLRETLWKFYSDGGSGAEWYFGYNTANGKGGDLAMEDFSLRESAYAWAAAARMFFEDLPLEEMTDGDGLTSGTNGADAVLAKAGEVYAIYLPDGGTATLDLSGQSGEFSVRWYDVLTGKFSDGTVSDVQGGGKVNLGSAPYDTTTDWAILVERTGGAPAPNPDPDPKPDPDPDPLPDPDPTPDPVPDPDFGSLPQPTIVGTSSSSEALVGTNGVDVISGGEGNDRISANGGADVLIGGEGNNVLVGGDGADLFAFDLGNWDGLRDDVKDFDIGEGDTILLWNLLPEGVSGRDIADYVRFSDRGTISSMEVDLSGGGDSFEQVAILRWNRGLTLEDALADDVLFFEGAGSSAQDPSPDPDSDPTPDPDPIPEPDPRQEPASLPEPTITGDSGNNTLRGGTGSDVISGENGNDTLIANGGADVLIGGAGSDALRGGAGGDLFVFDLGQWDGSEDDIKDFDMREGDAVLLANLLPSGISAADIGDYVRFVDNGTLSILQVDQNGGGNSFVDLAKIRDGRGMELAETIAQDALIFELSAGDPWVA